MPPSIIFEHDTARHEKNKIIKDTARYDTKARRARTRHGPARHEFRTLPTGQWFFKNGKIKNFKSSNVEKKSNQIFLVFFTQCYIIFVKKIKIYGPKKKFWITLLHINWHNHAKICKILFAFSICSKKNDPTPDIYLLFKRVWKLKNYFIIFRNSQLMLQIFCLIKRYLFTELKGKYLILVKTSVVGGPVSSLCTVQKGQ
jgi:hypothetical protein